MAQIIRSGAFLQQCWSIHPLCVTVKRVSDDRRVVLACSACRSAHRLTLATVMLKASPTQGAKTQAPEDEQGCSGDTLLGACLTAHHASVTLSTMDVFQDFVLLRCADCRRHYELTVSSFETYQK
jgi:hypothetical protein